MKLVTFQVAGPLGNERRLGALTEQARIVDLTSAYATYLARHTDEPTPRELAQLRTPPDLIGWLRGQHKAREAAEQALAFARDSPPNTRGLDDARLVFERSEVKPASRISPHSDRPIVVVCIEVTITSEQHVERQSRCVGEDVTKLEPTQRTLEGVSPALSRGFERTTDHQTMSLIVV